MRDGLHLEVALDSESACCLAAVLDFRASVLRVLCHAVEASTGAAACAVEMNGAAVSLLNGWKKLVKHAECGVPGKGCSACCTTATLLCKRFE